MAQKVHVIVIKYKLYLPVTISLLLVTNIPMEFHKSDPKSEESFEFKLFKITFSSFCRSKC